MSTKNVTIDYCSKRYPLKLGTLYKIVNLSGLVYIFATDPGQIRLIQKTYFCAVSSTHTNVTAHHTNYPLPYDSFLLTSSINLFLLAPNFLLMILRVKVKSDSLAHHIIIVLRRAEIVVFERETWLRLS